MTDATTANETTNNPARVLADLLVQATLEGDTAAAIAMSQQLLAHIPEGATVADVRELEADLNRVLNVDYGFEDAVAVDVVQLIAVAAVGLLNENAGLSTWTASILTRVPHVASAVHAEIADLYEQSESTDPALEHLDIALSRANDADQDLDEAQTFRRGLALGNLLNTTERFAEAEPWIRTALELSENEADDEDLHELLHAFIAMKTGLDQNDEELAAAETRLVELHEAAEAAKAPAKSDKIGRNDPCPCGSGKKYKQCHGRAD